MNRERLITFARKFAPSLRQSRVSHAKKEEIYHKWKLEFNDRQLGRRHRFSREPKSRFNYDILGAEKIHSQQEENNRTRC